MNRPERQRIRTFGRNAGKQSRGPSPAFRATFLAFAALAGVFAGAPNAAQAQLIDPPDPVNPPGCTVNAGGTSAVCQGPLAIYPGGLEALGQFPITNPTGTLNTFQVLNLPAQIGGNGVSFTAENASLTLNVDVAPNGINSAGDGVSALIESLAGLSAGNGSITIDTSGNIVATIDGINAEVRDVVVPALRATDYFVTIRSQSDITSSFRGIFGQVPSSGTVDITSNGVVTVNAAVPPGFFADPAGIVADNLGTGVVRITANGDVIVTNAGAPDPFFPPTIVGRAFGIATPAALGDPNFPSDVLITTGAGTRVTAEAPTAATGIFATSDFATIRIVSDGTLIRATSPGDSRGIEATTGSFSIGAGGPISITSNGAVEASDVGILATSNGISNTLGGGVVVDSNGMITVIDSDGDGQAIGISASTTLSGDVNVDASQMITVSGTNAIGLLAVANGTGNAIATVSGTVNAQAGATGVQVGVQPGGTGTANVDATTVLGGTTSAINFVGPAGSTNVLNTTGPVTLTATSGIAVTGGPGNTAINNRGVLNTVANGAIELGGGVNAFNNRFGGVFNSGMTVNLGAGNRFLNEGVVSPGGVGAIATTNITGNFDQTPTGELLTDLDVGASNADLVNVSGAALLDGNVRVQATNLQRLQSQVTILSAAGGTTNSGLGLLASPALNARLGFPNPNDVVLFYNLDFTAPGQGLNRNQTNLATYFNNAFDAGSGGLIGPFEALTTGVFSIEDYRAGLNQFLPEIYLNTQEAALFSSRRFSDELFECSSDGKLASKTDENWCAWVSPRGGVSEFDGTFENIAFDNRFAGLSAGIQRAFDSNWFANAAFGFEDGRIETATGADSTSNTYQGGLSIKYDDGKRFAGVALSGGTANFDTTRPISIGGFNATAHSDHQVGFVTGQLSAAYEGDLDTFYARPSVDARLTYLNRQGLTETGGGAANLAVAGSDGTYFSVSPSIEVGRTFAYGDQTTIRPFAKTGLTYLADNEHVATSQFLAAPAGIGTFTTTAEFDNLFADVDVGLEILRANEASFGLGYHGMFSSNSSQHGAYAKGTFRF